MSRITKEYIDNAVKTGWIIHDYKKVEVPNHFYTVLDTRTGEFYDPISGFTKDKPKEKRILEFEKKSMKLGHIMYLNIGDSLHVEEPIIEYKLGDGAIYFFTLFYTENGPKWDMTGMYVFRDGEWETPSEYAFCSFKNEKMHMCSDEEELVERISGDMFTHSVFVRKGEHKPLETESSMVNVFLIALGDIIYKIRDITRISPTEKGFLVKSLLDNEVIGGNKTLKNLIWCHKNMLYSYPVSQNLSIPIRALSEYGCYRALGELIQTRETNILKNGDFNLYGAARIFDYARRFSFEAIDLLTIEKMIFIAINIKDQDDTRKFADKAVYNLRNYGEFFFKKFIHDRYLEAKEEKAKIIMPTPF